MEEYQSIFIKSGLEKAYLSSSFRPVLSLVPRAFFRFKMPGGETRLPKYSKTRGVFCHLAADDFLQSVTAVQTKTDIINKYNKELKNVRNKNA